MGEIEIKREQAIQKIKMGTYFQLLIFFSKYIDNDFSPIHNGATFKYFEINRLFHQGNSMGSTKEIRKKIYSMIRAIIKKNYLKNIREFIRSLRKRGGAILKLCTLEQKYELYSFNYYIQNTSHLSCKIINQHDYNLNYQLSLFIIRFNIINFLYISIFENLVCKLYNTQSNQIAQWDTDVFKNYRSPFEKNLIQHSGALEQLNDFVFERLQAGRHGRVNHPMILTECFATTDLARMIVLEQMFECYQVPSVMLGVDALFSVFQDDLEAYLKQTQLIVHLGDQTVHVVPIVNGQVIYSNIKRLNLGGLNSLKYFYQTIQLRHPHLKFTYAQMDYWHKQYTSVAIDYQLQLRYFQGPQQYYGYRDKISEQNRFYDDQLQFLDPIYIDIPIVQKIVSAEDLKRKDENRQKMRVRLQESIQQSRQNKKSQLEQQLLALQQELEIDQNNDELKKKITTLQVKLGLAPKEALDELKYNLLNVPDDKLTPSQLNQKRYQKVMHEQALLKKQKNQEFKQLQKDANKFKLEEPEKYLQMLYEKRDRIVLSIYERKKLQQEMNSRNSRFNQKRIQTLAFLGADDKVEDDFGKDDKDWEIYRSVTKEIDSADEKSKYKLQELEQELKDLDPDFEIKILKSIANIHQLGMNLSQVQLSVDRVRCQEIYFQPNLIGVEQQGLVDMIKLSSKGLDKLLLQNIILTGGGAKTQGIMQRLQKDLISEYDCPVAIKIAPDPVFGTWFGMKNFANKYQSMLSQFSISIDDYNEIGIVHFKLFYLKSIQCQFIYNTQKWEIFKQHPFSNIVD